MKLDYLKQASIQAALWIAPIATCLAETSPASSLSCYWLVQLFVRSAMLAVIP
jgi:hypothetical protein